jgi:hypothetical protein
LPRRVYLVGTGIFRRQAADFERFSLAKRRDHFGPDTPSREGKLDFGPQIVIPAKSLFFRSTGVDDDFVVDAFFADAVPARLGHRVLDFDG